MSPFSVLSHSTLLKTSVRSEVFELKVGTLGLDYRERL